MLVGDTLGRAGKFTGTFDSGRTHRAYNIFFIFPTVPGGPCNWFTPSQFTYRKILHRVTTLSRYSIHLVAVTDNYNSCYYEQSALQWQCCRDTNRILSQWSYCLKNTFSAYKIFLYRPLKLLGPTITVLFAIHQKSISRMWVQCWSKRMHLTAIDNLIKQSECREKQAEHHMKMVLPALTVSMKNHMPKVTISLSPWG